MSGIAVYARGAILDAIFNGVALQKTARYVQLHVGDPGLDCLSNPALNTQRQSLTSAASVNGVFTSPNTLQWLSVAATEVYTHVSVWDAPTGGNALWSGPLAAPQAVNAGDEYSIPPGDLAASVT